MSTYQPRYVAYAIAHEKIPEDMLAFDKERYPGGCMTGFMLWIQNKWRVWAKLTGTDLEFLGEKEHEAFDIWLKNCTLTKGVETDNALS